MAVRVKVRLEALLGGTPGATVEAVALANTGYEADQADCSLPREAAARLGLWPPPASKARRHVVRSYSGRVDVFKVPEAARIRVITPDRQGPEVTAGVLLTETDDEIIMSDTLVELLQLALVRPGRGGWRFVDETDERPSERPQIW